MRYPQFECLERLANYKERAGRPENSNLAYPVYTYIYQC